MITIDQVRTHEDTGTGDDTVPTGITGLDWCHLISTSSIVELEGFITLNLLTLGVLIANIRTPALGSQSTYVGMTQAQHDAAVLAGAVPNRQTYVQSHSFDAQTSSPYYEP